VVDARISRPALARTASDLTNPFRKEITR
jgi:hypothetical protein